MAYYAIQDTNVGMIQFVTTADDAAHAVRLFDADVGIDPHGVGLEKVAETLEVTELTAAQYEQLKDCDGTDNAAIALLESFK